MTSTKIKKIELNVPRNYNLDSWFLEAKPEEIAIVLDLAGRLPRIIGDEKNDMAAKLYAARKDGTNEAIKKVFQEASQLADTKMKNEITQLQYEFEKIKEENAKLCAKNQQYEKEILVANENKQSLQLLHSEEINTLKKISEHDLIKKDHEINLELSKIKSYENHLKETALLKEEALKREITLQSAQEYSQLQEEYTKIKTNYADLQQNVELKVQLARQDEKMKVDEQHAAVYTQLQSAKIDVEQNLVNTITEKCKLTEELTTLTMTHAKEVSNFQKTIGDLKNPMGRGNAGEIDVAQTLTDIGYFVEDTSDGEKKQTGYLDLLIKIDSDSHENMRIAVEVKNKQTIKKASDDKVKKKEKDLDDDIKTFQQRVREGIKNGLFDGAIFVSIRAHTKMGAPVVLEMFEDTTNRPLAPVSYIGPEKSKVILPLTQEQLETQVYMMFCVLEQSHNIRRDLCNGLKDEEISSFQTLFEEMGSYINATFTDLRKQEHLINEMSSNLTNVRCKSVKMFRSIYKINAKIPWLQRKIDADWVSVYETAKERAITMNDADVWNKVSKNKATIENSIGKDAMLLCIRSENHKAHEHNYENEDELCERKAKEPKV
jgi:hypothetical protein